MDSIQVEIFGQTYSLKGGVDGDYIRTLASFVDARMKEVQKGTGTADGFRIAILAALNIADELHRLKAQYAVLEKNTSSSLDKLIELTRDIV